MTFPRLLVCTIFLMILTTLYIQSKAAGSRVPKLFKVASPFDHPRSSKGKQANVKQIDDIYAIMFIKSC